MKNEDMQVVKELVSQEVESQVAAMAKSFENDIALIHDRLNRLNRNVQKIYAIAMTSKKFALEGRTCFTEATWDDEVKEQLRTVQQQVESEAQKDEKILAGVGAGRPT